jgi:hypothetical protein
MAVLISAAVIGVMLVAPGFRSDPSFTGNTSFSNAKSPPIQHVILDVLENKNYSTIVTTLAYAPYLTYIRQLANGSVQNVKSGLITNYYGVRYPSTPNYIALTSGSYYGYPVGDTDYNPNQWNVSTSKPSIFNQTPWKVFAQSMPSNCFLTNNDTGTNNEYVAHHSPAPYYLGDVRTECAKDDVPMGTFSSGNLYNSVKNLNGQSLPPFSMVVGNICNDMHTCSSNGNYSSFDEELINGDNFTENLVTLVKNSSYWSSTVIFIVWDTGDPSTTNGGGQVAFIAASGASNFLLNGRTSIGNGFVDHFNTASTIETCLGLPVLNSTATSFCPSIFSNSTTTTDTTTTQLKT